MGKFSDGRATSTTWDALLGRTDNSQPDWGQLNPVGLIHPRRRLWHENASGGGGQLPPEGHRKGFEQVGDVNPFEILSPLFWDWQQV